MVEIVDLWLNQLTFPILMGSFINKYLGHLIKSNGTLITQHFTRHWGNEQKMGFHHQNVVQPGDWGNVVSFRPCVAG